MKHKSQLKHKILASVLISTYALFWLSWGFHHVFSPEHQHETKICRHAPNEKHLHGAEYASIDCEICHIAPTLADLPTLQLQVLLFPELIPTNNNFGETTINAISPFAISQPRAPPGLHSCI
jgi:hypothetical protein